MNANSESERVRAEHRVVQDLADRVQRRVAVAPRAEVDRWASEIRGDFERFRAHLVQHMALEEKDGFMVSVAERRPGLLPRLERLCREHREIERLLRDLHQRLDELGPQDLLLARDWCHRVIDLLHYVGHHEDEENDLVELVFTQDFGAKD